MQELMETAYKLAMHWSDKVREDMDDDAVDNFKDAVKAMKCICMASESKCWEKFHASM